MMRYCLRLKLKPPLLAVLATLRGRREDKCCLRNYGHNILSQKMIQHFHVIHYKRFPRCNQQTLEEGETECLGNTEWCKCRKCIPMPTSLESSCCPEINEVVGSIPEGVECITHSESFEIYCVNEQNVRVNTICLHLEGPPTVDPDNNRRLRKTAYITFTAWIYGYLGKGNRRVIPSCAVNAVRNAIPDPSASYVGFMYSNDYEASEMALE
ncbi:uncharacterized protein LOC143933189 [Lithobates pipiens]